MKRYTVSIEASFNFDIDADNEEQAVEKARELLRTQDPINDHGGLDGRYDAPWIAPARADDDYPSLEVVDVFGEEE